MSTTGRSSGRVVAVGGLEVVVVDHPPAASGLEITRHVARVRSVVIVTTPGHCVPFGAGVSVRRFAPPTCRGEGRQPAEAPDEMTTPFPGASALIHLSAAQVRASLFKWRGWLDSRWQCVSVLEREGFFPAPRAGRRSKRQVGSPRFLCCWLRDEPAGPLS